MPRKLIGSLFAAVLAASAVVPSRAAPARGAPGQSAALQRFFALADPQLADCRAFRHLEARNDHFNSSAWMDVWTDAQRSGGFRYDVVAEGGSAYIRTRVLTAALETEQRLWKSGIRERAALTADNYVFDDHGEQRDGLTWLTVRPRRKDILLIEGSVFLTPDGDLERLEGRLSKAPSVWTRHVDIVRRYRRIGGVRMPVEVESVATLLVAGRSTFRMTYEYEVVNGQHVGTPSPRTTLH
jgi:hypothetical protein